MVFVTAGMGGGTGTGAAPVIAQAAREAGILTVGVITKPFHFEGTHRMKLAEAGIAELQKHVDTLIIIPNQNLFRIANEKTTFADAFRWLKDAVFRRGCMTDLMVMPGLINLDFADMRAVMGEMGKAMMGTGEATGERRAIKAAEAAIANPLLDEISMKGARGLLISITGGNDLTLFEVDEAASRIREEVDQEANIILGATFDFALDGSCASRSSPPASTGDDGARRAAAAQRRRFARRRQPVVDPDGAASDGACAAPVVAAARHPPEPAPSRRARSRPGPSPRPRPGACRPPAAMEEEEEPMEEDFIPPAPEPMVRSPRMPTIDELPAVVQPAVRQARGELPPPPQPERRRSLLEKLAAFGISRPEDMAPRATAPLSAAAPAHAGGAVAARAQIPRPPQGQLDAQGRQQPRTLRRTTTTSWRSRRSSAAPTAPDSASHRLASPCLPAIRIEAAHSCFSRKLPMAKLNILQLCNDW